MQQKVPGKKKVLVVDDERECCELLKKFFLRRDYIVDTAYDGMQAKNLLEVRKYDYIFFDCNMPELSGVELVKVIKEKNPEAKRVMISGYGYIEENFAKQLDVDIFLNKPVTLKDIEGIISG